LSNNTRILQISVDKLFPDAILIKVMMPGGTETENERGEEI
jgi:hypothetical protein